MIKKAVITGGTRGIGRAIAERLATEGYAIAVCSNDATDLDNMTADFAERFADVELIAEFVDLSKKEEVLKFAQLIDNQWHRVDILVNNAGIYTPSSIYTEGDGLLEKMLSVNLFAAYHLTRALLPLMLPLDKAFIFNMSSIASITAYANGGAYAITKYALLGFSENLRETLKTSNIKVTALLPGATWSDLWTGFEAPKERLMQAQDIAEAVMSALKMSDSAVVEKIILRPQLGDL